MGSSYLTISSDYIKLCIAYILSLDLKLALIGRGSDYYSYD